MKHYKRESSNGSSNETRPELHLVDACAHRYLQHAQYFCTRYLLSESVQTACVRVVCLGKCGRSREHDINRSHRLSRFATVSVELSVRTDNSHPESVARAVWAHLYVRHVLSLSGLLPRYCSHFYRPPFQFSMFCSQL
jgi:hypothetical protein